MLAKLLIELLSLIPNLAAQTKAILAEAHSNDSTGTKVANIATVAAAIAGQASDVIDEATQAVK